MNNTNNFICKWYRMSIYPFSKSEGNKWLLMLVTKTLLSVFHYTQTKELEILLQHIRFSSAQYHSLASLMSQSSDLVRSKAIARCKGNAKQIERVPGVSLFVSGFITTSWLQRRGHLSLSWFQHATDRCRYVVTRQRSQLNPDLHKNLFIIQMFTKYVILYKFIGKYM